MPLTQLSVEEQDLPKRTIRVETATGQVDLDVTGVEYPFVEGRARPGEGEVLFDVTKATSATIIRPGTMTSG